MVKKQVLTYTYTRERRTTYEQNIANIVALFKQAGLTDYSSARNTAMRYCNNFYRKAWRPITPLTIYAEPNKAEYAWIKPLTDSQIMALTAHQRKVRERSINRKAYYNHNFTNYLMHTGNEIKNNINLTNSNYATRRFNRKAENSPTKAKAKTYMEIRSAYKTLLNQKMKDFDANQIVDFIASVNQHDSSTLSRILGDFYNALHRGNHSQPLRLNNIFNRAHFRWDYSRHDRLMHVARPELVTEMEDGKLKSKLVKYYPTLKAFVDNKPITTKFGKFITWFNGVFGLAESQIKTLVDTFSYIHEAEKFWQVEFIAHDDKKGWSSAYRTGPHSCMKKNPKAVQIYAHEKSVLNLAVVRHTNTNEVLARAIVRTDTKTVVRVYPDPDGGAEGRFLKDYLKANGFPKVSGLDGCLLDVVVDRNNSSNELTYISTDWVYLDHGNGGNQHAYIVTDTSVTPAKPYFMVGKRGNNVSGLAYSGNQQGYINLLTDDAKIVRDYVLGKNPQTDKSPNVADSDDLEILEILELLV